MRFRLIVLSLLLPALPLAAQPRPRIIPVSALVQGANGTFFRTDVRIFNPSEAASVEIGALFFPADPAAPPVPERSITVAPRQMAVLNNVVGEFFGASGLGAIVFASPGEIVVTSRTYTDSPGAPGGGTLGQFVPAVERAAALTRGVILQLSNHPGLADGYRTNFGFFNPNVATAKLAVELRRPDGSLIRAASIEAPPHAMQQGGINSFTFEDAYLIFTSTLPVIAYASVVDNLSGDAIFVPAAPYGDE